MRDCSYLAAVGLMAYISDSNHSIIKTLCTCSVSRIISIFTFYFKSVFETQVIFNFARVNFQRYTFTFL